MADSMNLITAQISFLEPRLALIHIPIELYSLCLQPILRLLFGEDHDEDAAKISWTNRHEFLNVSITPVECSIICSRNLSDRFVVPVANALNRLYTASTASNSSSNGVNGSHPKTEIQISSDDYIVIQVDGQGLDAGQRVLELTSPLAMAGISIFFITTYFSDYILVPFRQRRTVTKALQQRGFVFSQTADAFVSQLSPSSPALGQNGRPGGSSSSSMNSPPPPLLEREREMLTPTLTPTTPPAKDIPELQIRTFSRLKRNNIRPLVDSSVLLANCAGSREYNPTNDERLQNDLLQVLLATAALPPENRTSDVVGQGAPTATATATELDSDSGLASGFGLGAKFLSLTITSAEPISVLLEHRLLDRLGPSLLGAKSGDDALVPITLDLRDLPLEATGIVCGVAGRLAQGSTDDDQEAHSPKTRLGATQKVGDDALQSGPGPDESIEISFLSTARAGTVIVRATQLQQALDALEYGMKRVASDSEGA